MRYFFIRYLNENRYLSLKYCPTGEMFPDFFAKPLQGATFQRFWDMIQVIPESTPDVDMSFPRVMAKFTSQECVLQNYKQTHKKSIARRGIRGSMCTDVSTDRTGVSRSTCTEISAGRTFVHRSMCTYDKYDMHQPKFSHVKPGREHVGNDEEEKAREGFSYADAVQSMHIS